MTSVLTSLPLGARYFSWRSKDFLHQIKLTQTPYPTVLYADFFFIQTKHVTTVTMSKEYEGQDLLDIAARAERDLNSSEAKGSNRNDTSGSDSSQF